MTVAAAVRQAASSRLALPLACILECYCLAQVLSQAAGQYVGSGKTPSFGERKA